MRRLLFRENGAKSRGADVSNVYVSTLKIARVTKQILTPRRYQPCEVF